MPWVVAQLALLGAVLVAAVFGAADAVPWWQRLTGGSIAVAGIAMAMMGARTLGRNLTPLPEPTRFNRLVDTGIYARVRHPIYGGLVLIGLGASVTTGSVAALVVWIGLVALLIAKARHEEELLLARHPEYTDYRRRVRRTLIPGVL
ncbi:hypothetical protein BH24ACT7_BH24ACT7_23970 [soil metagenome]